MKCWWGIHEEKRKTWKAEPQIEGKYQDISLVKWGGRTWTEVNRLRLRTFGGLL